MKNETKSKLGILFFLAAIFSIFLTLKCSAQVGIGTVTPTQTLDVDGTARIRTLDPSTSTSIVVAEPDGTLGVSTISNLTSIVVHYPTVNMAGRSGSGIYFGEYDPTTFSIPFPFPNQMVQQITIPDGETAWVEVNVYMPMGVLVETVDIDVIGYQGIQLRKDGVLIEAASTKVSWMKNIFLNGTGQNPDLATFRCHPVSVYWKEEVVDVMDGNDTIIEYEVYKYLEHYYKSIAEESISYFWGMWSQSGNNYNWGRARMDIKVTF